jgi:hypothetical protein
LEIWILSQEEQNPKRTIIMKPPFTFYNILSFVIIFWAFYSSVQIAITDAVNTPIHGTWKEVILNNGNYSTCNDNARIKTVVVPISTNEIAKGNCDGIWLILLPPSEYSSFFGT